MAYAPVASFGGGVHGLQHGLDFVDVMGDQHAGWRPTAQRRRRLPAARSWVKSNTRCRALQPRVIDKLQRPLALIQKAPTAIKTVAN